MSQGPVAKCMQRGQSQEVMVTMPIQCQKSFDMSVSQTPLTPCLGEQHFIYPGRRCIIKTKQKTLPRYMDIFLPVLSWRMHSS